jgi:uncharacterized protein YjbI with pentapeptide repeats
MTQQDTALQKAWKILNTPVPELLRCRPETLLDGTEAGIVTANTSLAAAALAGVAVAPAAPVIAAALPFVLISMRCLQRFHDKPAKERTFEDCVVVVAQLAYLKNLKDFFEDNKLLSNKDFTQLSQGVQPQIEQLSKLTITEEEAHQAIRCFAESELAKQFNQLLLNQLQQLGIKKNQSLLLTKRVAYRTYRYISRAIYDSRNELEPLVEWSGDKWRHDSEKYTDIEEYLRDKISPKTRDKTQQEQWLVFEEKFLISAIYVPQKVMPINKDGKEDKNAKPFDLEPWVKKLLLNSRNQNKVIFIQGEPGRGKSVFCRILADWVRRELHPIWTPILIRLQGINNLRFQYILQSKNIIPNIFSNIDSTWSNDKNTRFLFLLDGFDELVLERGEQGLEEFFVHIEQFQKNTHHQFLVTGRTLALQNIERQLKSLDLERVQIQPMDEKLQKQWLQKWAKQVGEEKKDAFWQFLQQESLKNVRTELAREPLLLYLLAAMHRDGHLSEDKFKDTQGIEAKITLYQECLRWVLEEQRQNNLNQRLTNLETAGLQRILTEAALCVVQSGRGFAAVSSIKKRIDKDQDQEAADLLKSARGQSEAEKLNNALLTFFIHPASDRGSVEFVHKSFSEFLFAMRLQQGLEQAVELEEQQGDWLIYDLLGYGALTREIVEYLMGLLTIHPINGEGRQNKEFLVQLFQRLESFYLRWSDGEFIDTVPPTLPQEKMLQLQEQLPTKSKLGQRQVDIYTGLNVLILLLELHRYARSRDELKDKITFHLCGKDEDFDRERFFRLISYSNCLSVFAFLQIVGFFLSDANLSGAHLSRADLSLAFLSDADLSGADLSGADLSDADLSGADLSDADLSDADLSDAALSDADLSDADLSGARLSDANLSGADLSRADLSDADLSDAALSDADLSGADLSDADLSGAHLSDANLSDANLSGADLSGADLSGADLSGADLSGADLSDNYYGDIIWNEKTDWKDVRGLDTAQNVPAALKQQLGLK